jgi:hypothetical protein
MRRSLWLIFTLAFTMAITSCSDNGNGNGPDCTTASECDGTLPDGCDGYWECIGQKCEPICTGKCETATDCESGTWPINADCSESEGQWSCENEVCRVICPVLTWSTRMEVDLEQAGVQLDIEPTADGQFAIAYFKRVDEFTTCGTSCSLDPDCATDFYCNEFQCCQEGCTEPILGDTMTRTHRDTIRYAKFDGTNWNVEDVATISTVMLSGISMTFRGNTPLVAYLGGTPHGGRQVCGGTDLIVADGPGNWNETTAVAVSSEAAAGGDCPKMQAICDFGDVVGLWPSIARSQDGSTIGVVYRDVHNGYTKDADDAADLEYAFSTGGGWGHEWVDLARGSGDFSSLAFGNDGEPAVAYYNGEVGTTDLKSPILFAKRPWAEWTQPVMPCTTNADCPNGQACAGQECVCTTDSQCESPMRCIDTHRCSAVVAALNGGLDEKSISLAVGPDGRYLVAYYDPDAQNLMIAHSEDGKNWSRGIVDSDGNTGKYPSIVILPNTNKPAIAYYRCNVYRPGETSCDTNDDGPRFAYFKGEYPLDLTSQTKWKKSYVSSTGDADSVAFDGRHISLAVLPDGTIGVAYYYSWVSGNETLEHLMFHKGTWE